MSRVFITAINERMGGALDLALQIFDHSYERPFFHQLVSSQLDMDRLDYLRRDAFYTGVAEGEVGVQRLIKTLRVHPLEGGPDAEVTVEAKGVYAVENFLLSRRLMYWQVYMHKTVLAGDQLLRAIFRRVRRHLDAGTGHATLMRGSEHLVFFLQYAVDAGMLDDPEVRRRFVRLDDTDVLFSLKQWMASPDRVLADLCRRFIERDFFRVTFVPEAPAADDLAAWREAVADWLVCQELSTPDEAQTDATFYLTLDASRHAAYHSAHEGIGILDRRGRVRELSEVTDTATVAGLSRRVEKPYVCFPKAVELDLVATG
jgi:HD superfamily phosphohydrolase